jgi:CRISPR/Cas system-associated exonuclease Cas4 (RecB family)
MKQVSWSHSALKDYEGCPKRYQEVKVLKNFPFTETEATRYGNEVHKALELYIRNGKPVPPEYAQFVPVVDALMQRPGRKLAEQQMALTKDLKPCGWKDRDAWVRGIADLLILDDENMTAWVVDWKTGSNKYPDRDQLRLMALMVFAHYPHIRKVNAALLFIVKNDMVKLSMTVDQADTVWWDYRERVARLEQAFATDVWNAKPSPLCPWCPATTCVHHPKH